MIAFHDHDKALVVSRYSPANALHAALNHYRISWLLSVVLITLGKNKIGAY